MLHTEIWSDHHPVCLNEMKKHNKLRQQSPRRFKKSSLQTSLKTIHKSTESYSCFKCKGNFAVFEVIKLTASLLGERCWSFTHTISLSLYITSNPSICPSIYLWIIPYIWLIIHCFYIICTLTFKRLGFLKEVSCAGEGIIYLSKNTVQKL